jgi:hypothetical protein
MTSSAAGLRRCARGIVPSEIAKPELSDTDPRARTPLLSAAEADILRQLRSLRYGTLEVQVHDARVVQVERRERVRFDQRAG